jgi:hypothetical protein
MTQSTIEKNLTGNPNRNPLFEKRETLKEVIGGKEPTKKTLEGLVAPGDPSQKIIELSGITENQSQIFPLGTPNFRTLWSIESVSITFSALIIASGALPLPQNGEIGRQQIGVNLWIGGKIQPFILAEAPLNNLTTWEQISGEIHSGNGAEYLRRKLYMLELLSPLELSRGEQLAISFYMKETATQKLSKQMEGFLLMPSVVVSFDQEYPKLR